MSYKNLVLQACADKAELFCRLRDFLCARNGTYDYSTTGIGWTLHDTSYATDENNPQSGDWFVAKSAGEGGGDDLYFKFTWVSGYIAIYGFLYWDAASHAGTHQYNSSNNWWIADTGSYELSVYGDLDFVVCVESVNASYDYICYFGKLTDTVYDTTVATCASALTSGSDVSITLDAVPSSWQAGNRIFIRDSSRIDLITIKTISGNTITTDLSYAYAAGSKLAECVPYVCQSSYSNLNCYAAVGHSTTTSLSAYEYYANFSTSVDPDKLNDDYIAMPCCIAGADTYVGQLPSVWRIGVGTLTEKSALTGDSFSARYFKFYSSIYLLIKEV